MTTNSIGQCCNITTGKLDANKAVSNGGYPFYTCAEFPDRIDTYAFDDDVVLVAGNNASGNFHVSRFQGKFNAYQRTYVLTAKDGVDIDYVYYALKLELKRLREKSQGSQTKFLTMPILTNIAFSDIGYDEQVEISSVLSQVDRKIELNKKINVELEATAKLIYDYWFVQFDFPDGNGEPYKSSGGKMEYNEALKRDIPDGWQVARLGDTVKTSLGGTPSTKNPEFWENADIPWLNSGEVANFPALDSEEKITQAGIDESAAELLPKGSVIISIVRHLRVSILAIDAAFNQSVVGLYETDSLTHAFLYPYLFRELPRLMSLRTGAQQPHINKGVVDDSHIVLPPDVVLKKYYRAVNALYEKITTTSEESKKQIELRDWLLPMLMSGQVTVKNF